MKRSTWKIVVGIILVLISIPMIGAGLVGVVFFGPDGRYTSGSEEISTQTSALVTEPLDIVSGVSANNLPSATLSLQLKSAGSGDLFIGIGPAADVDRYLSGVAVEQIDSFDLDPFRLSTTTVQGDRTPDAPDAQTFWVTKATGSGVQDFSWEILDGTYRLVIMNADGSPSVDVSGRLGLKIPWIFPVLLVFLILGVLMLIGGVLLIVFGSRLRPVRGGPPPSPNWTSTPPPPPPPPVGAGPG